MKRKTRIAVAAAVTVVTLGAAGVVAASATGDDEETPITGTDLQSASDAALQHTGQGQVTGTEVGDEDSYYEVEVTLDDGSQVDVQLDKNFELVDSKADTEDDGSDQDGSG